jgi:hypothetical protein
LKTVNKSEDWSDCRLRIFYSSFPSLSLVDFLQFTSHVLAIFRNNCHKSQGGYLKAGISFLKRVYWKDFQN